MYINFVSFAVAAKVVPDPESEAPFTCTVCAPDVEFLIK